MWFQGRLALLNISPPHGVPALLSEQGGPMQEAGHAVQVVRAP